MADSYRVPTTDPMDYGNRPGDGPLRVGGQFPPTGQLSSGPTSDENLPSTLSDAAQKQRPALTIVRDIAQGTEKVRDRGPVYLPKAPGEDADNYRARKERSVFFNVFGHTIEGLVGQVFRRDPALSEDVPPQILAHWENIDLCGTHGDVFCRDLLEDSLTAGHCAVLVDFPDTTSVIGPRINGKLTREADAIFRPYWVPIKKDNILSWRTTIENGRVVLTQVVLRECQMVPSGAFGEVEQTRYRVLYRVNGPEVNAPVVGFQLLAVTPEKVVILVDHGYYANQTEIPLAEIASAGRHSLFESAPPLLDLAMLNIAHYQQWSDYATSIHKTCVPLLTVIGAETTQDGGTVMVVGPNTVITLPPGGKAEYVSHSGQALGSCKQALDDLKSDMGTLGLSMLSPSKRTAETAQAKRLDKSTEDSALAVTARGLQDGLERCLTFHARYLKLESGGSIKINKEFDAQSMQADMLTAWTTAVATAGIPARLMLSAMQLGELIEPDEDIDALEAEMEGNAAAKQAQEQAAKADQLSMAASAGRSPRPGKVEVRNAKGEVTSTLAPAA